MKKTIICRIPAHPQQYEILIKSGLLQDMQLVDLLKPLAHRFVIIADSDVANHIGKKFAHGLRESGLQVDLFTFPAGEEHKSRQTKEMLEEKMLDAKCGRDTALIAIGGGVTTDLGGFIAATYNRGIPLVMIPTSLLAMVDASIGGKNGVDVPQGKNLIGTFYQPKYVFIDPNVLRTLPDKELRNGAVEMIKHALIADVNYFKFFQTHVKQFITLDPETMVQAIYDSCIIKMKIVEEDEKETGKRRLLNCGHTLAHAIESLTNYQIAHGEAVAIGIVIEGYISHHLGRLSTKEFEEMLEVFHDYGIPLKSLEGLEPSQILDATILDKKSLKGKSRYVLLEKIGSPLTFEGNYCTTLDEPLLLQGIKWYMDKLK